MYLGIPINALNLTDGGCSPCLYQYQLGASWPDGYLGTWTVQTVPEPPTIVLVAAGLLAVGGGLWRRRRSI